MISSSVHSAESVQYVTAIIPANYCLSVSVNCHIKVKVLEAMFKRIIPPDLIMSDRLLQMKKMIHTRHMRS